MWADESRDPVSPSLPLLSSRTCACIEIKALAPAVPRREGPRGEQGSQAAQTARLPGEGSCGLASALLLEQVGAPGMLSQPRPDLWAALVR